MVVNDKIAERLKELRQGKTSHLPGLRKVTQKDVATEVDISSATFLPLQ